mmetsp:Transcript_6928/g.10133  ORF Transcript_6928/g.10133 Transcript_6928/m.10133 type:complete len:95 (+) Transcript_6928:1-285(+)
MFLKACAMLSLTKDRQSIGEKAFKRCCRAGQVSNNVLDKLRVAVPCVYNRLEKTYGKQRQLDENDLPKEWRSKVLNVKVNRNTFPTRHFQKKKA